MIFANVCFFLVNIALFVALVVRNRPAAKAPPTEEPRQFVYRFDGASRSKVYRRVGYAKAGIRRALKTGNSANITRHENRLHYYCRLYSDIEQPPIF